MNLIEQHVTGERDETKQYIGHFTDGSAAVRVTVHRDPYAFQCRGGVAVWTNDRGYQTIVTADPDAIYGRRRLPESDLIKFAMELIDTYKALTGKPNAYQAGEKGRTR